MSPPQRRRLAKLPLTIRSIRPRYFAALREVTPPFSPEQVVEQFSSLLRSYNCRKVVGDRYGLRRLRGAMALFKKLLGDTQSERIKSELKWLTGELAPARDLDVYERGKIEPLRSVPGQNGDEGIGRHDPRLTGRARANAAQWWPARRPAVLVARASSDPPAE